MDVSPSKGPWSVELLRKAGKLHDADPSLRRSERSKIQNKGFKGKGCLDKRCFACDSEPLIISPFIIKNLSVTFCDIDAAKVDEPVLAKNKKVSAPGDKRPGPKKNSKADDDKAPKKKSKK